MDSLRNAERATIFRASPLAPNIEGESCTGFTNVVRNIGSGSILWAGYNFINNDAATRFIQIFFRPASEVILGTTLPDDVFLLGSSGTIVHRFNEDEFVTQGRALSISVTTTENGTTGPTNAVTGSIYYLP